MLRNITHINTLKTDQLFLKNVSWNISSTVTVDILCATYCFGEGDLTSPPHTHTHAVCRIRILLPLLLLFRESANEAGGWSDGRLSDSPLGFQAINNIQTATPAFLSFFHFLSLILFIFIISLPDVAFVLFVSTSSPTHPTSRLNLTSLTFNPLASHLCLFCLPLSFRQLAPRVF